MFTKENFLKKYSNLELQFDHFDRGFIYFLDSVTKISCKGQLNLHEGFSARESLDNLTNLEHLEICVGNKKLDEYIKDMIL